MTKKTKPIKSLPTELKQNWGLLLTLGILLVILGTLGLGMIVGLTFVSMIFFGIALIVGGMIQLLDTFNDKQWQGAIWHALIALLYLIAGGIVIYDPFLASTLITGLLGVVLIAIGIGRLIMSLMIRHSPGWMWPLFSAFIAIVLGLLILFQWPMSGLWIIGLFIAIELLVNGWTYILLALSIRRT